MKKKIKKKAKAQLKPETNKPEQDKETTDGFYFGGLPVRDLKKNLGCG